jgi:hypothetical protein
MLDIALMFMEGHISGDNIKLHYIMKHRLMYRQDSSSFPTESSRTFNLIIWEVGDNRDNEVSNQRYRGGCPEPTSIPD